jgi:hypothetical protein
MCRLFAKLLGFVLLALAVKMIVFGKHLKQLHAEQTVQGSDTTMLH